MNFKLLAATTLLFTIGSATAALSINKEDISLFQRTRQCVDCNLSNINSPYTYFINKDFRNANLQGANLYNSVLVGSDLRNANLSNTNSKSTRFDKADLRNANFSYANISGADFCKADLRGVNWTGIIFDNKTKCLPNEAIDYVHTVSSNSNHNQNSNNCPSIAPISEANSRSLKEDANDIKEATETVKDILKLF